MATALLVKGFARCQNGDIETLTTLGQASYHRDRGAGVELARGQPFQVRVGLELEVEPLEGGMTAVAVSGAFPDPPRERRLALPAGLGLNLAALGPRRHWLGRSRSHALRDLAGTRHPEPPLQDTKARPGSSHANA